MKLKHKRWLRRGLGITLLFAGLVSVVSPLMVWGASPYVFREVADLPSNDVALVLGTVSRLANGSPNPHFEHRMDAAALLYQRGKVRHLLVSGDNSRHGYNEPEDMKQALIKRGVPAHAITADYAGFRTLDSLVRAKHVFCLSRFTVVSDAFHTARAVFLGRSQGLEVTAFCSEDVGEAFSRKVKTREEGARVRAFLDVYVLNTQPKFLGEKLPIAIAANPRPL